MLPNHRNNLPSVLSREKEGEKEKERIKEGVGSVWVVPFRYTCVPLYHRRKFDSLLRRVTVNGTTMKPEYEVPEVLVLFIYRQQILWVGHDKRKPSDSVDHGEG